MRSECRTCNWSGDANELNWKVRDGDRRIGGERVCPECRGADVALPK